MAPSDNLEESLKSLSVSGKQSKVPKSSKPSAVAESWEDSADAASSSSGEDSPSGTTTPTARQLPLQTPLTSPHSADIPRVPPPTPASPRQAAVSFSRDSLANSRFGAVSPGRSSDSDSPRTSTRADGSVRPEKTTAVASRMIAAGLGLKAPKKTEEQRRYDRAARENEIRRKNQEKEAKKREEEERERAKAAVWDD